MICALIRCGGPHTPRGGSQHLSTYIAACLSVVLEELDLISLSSAVGNWHVMPDGVCFTPMVLCKCHSRRKEVLMLSSCRALRWQPVSRRFEVTRPHGSHNALSASRSGHSSHRTKSCVNVSTRRRQADRGCLGLKPNLRKFCLHKCPQRWRVSASIVRQFCAGPCTRVSFESSVW